MLLKFSDSDILNTELVDALSGQIKYTVLSRATYIQRQDKQIVEVTSRTTIVTNAFGKVVATIEWTGREKRSGGLITIMDDEPVKFAELFDGYDSVKTQPDQLVIPSRLGLVWIATRNSLFVRQADNDVVVGKYHERCVQVGSKVQPSPLPKVGRDYLEFIELPEDTLAELLVDYIFMNIMRRTKFDLPRYRFPLVDDCSEVRQSIADILTHVKESISRRTAFRRNTL